MKRGDCKHCPEGTYKPLPGDSKEDCVKCGPKAKSIRERNTCHCHQSATELRHLKNILYFDRDSRQCVDMPLGYWPGHDAIYPPNSQFTKIKEEKCPVGSFCMGGVQYLCPEGYYGDKELETSNECSGRCKPGYYCPIGSTSPTQMECGGPNVICPERSTIPRYVRAGYYSNEEDPPNTKTSEVLCPPGFYCPGDGLRHKCPAGYFGYLAGLSDETCNGLCNPGYYCPPASTSPREIPCGNATVVCAEGSSTPILVPDGHYSAKTDNVLIDRWNYAGPNSTQDVSLLCEVGYYCSDGVKYQCPGGTYGLIEGTYTIASTTPLNLTMTNLLSIRLQT